MNIPKNEKEMVEPFGSFSNLCGFLGHEGMVAMCPECGAILHRNLMSFYPHKTCFNCGEQFIIYPYFLAEGIWWIKEKGGNVLSWDISSSKRYVEIELGERPKSLPVFWKHKEDLIPTTDIDKDKNYICFISVGYEEDCVDDVTDSFFAFSSWAKNFYNVDK